MRRFGRYEVLDELGGGTMGKVFRARDPAINRIVAIKSISLLGQPADARSEYRERFRREAEAAGRLSHPGIVTIFDVGDEPASHMPYIVMEYVKGKSLEQSGRLTSRMAAALVREMGEALDYAHKQGVIHRDLKPSNILLTEDNHAKIADFGVAKLNLSELTAHGQILGTPAFMSPEQLNGDPIDHRSDLFSLGVILYTLLTGHRPFQGNSVVTVSYKVVHHEPVPVEALNLNLPEGLNEIVGRAMAKNPAERYQRGRDMARDLQALLEQEAVWNNKEPGSAPPGLIEVTDRIYAKHSHGEAKHGGPLTARFQQRVKQMKKSRRVQMAGLLFGIGLVGAFVAWQISRRPLEAAPVSPSPLPVATATAPDQPNVSPKRTIAHPDSSRSRSAATVPLQISVTPKVGGANLTVWVDDQRVLHKQLETAAKKKLGLFGHGGSEQSESIYVTPGSHRLRVNVQSDSSDESHTVRGDFPEGSNRVLTVTFSNDNAMKVRLK